MKIKQHILFAVTLLALSFAVGSQENLAIAHQGTSETGDRVKILESWNGDFPVKELERLPYMQREQAVGFIGDARTFESFWKAFRPDETAPQIDFETNLVLFARNTQFYNHISIGQVNLKEGVAEVLAMETMSSIPIEDKVAMSLVVIARQGTSGIQSGDEVIPFTHNR